MQERKRQTSQTHDAKGFVEWRQVWSGEKKALGQARHLTIIGAGAVSELLNGGLKLYRAAVGVLLPGSCQQPTTMKKAHLSM